MSANIVFCAPGKNNHLYSYLNENNISFRQYLTGKEQILRYRGRNFMTRCIAGQDPGPADRPRAALSKAKRHLEKEFVFVGIQEHFDESLLLLGQTLGLDDLLYERRNSLVQADAIPVEQSDLDLARQINQGDRDLYDFALTLLEERIKEQGPGFQERLVQFRFLNEKYQRLSRLLREQAGVAEGHDNLALPKDGLW
ncbi:hypothetical protein LJB81_03875 [Desulfovibrio sp. OttesenSCG-928-M14]|nr:hypothetical protein [Desulfovibrio sp. OttesenSCG-928-M14]